MIESELHSSLNLPLLGLGMPTGQGATRQLTFRFRIFSLQFSIDMFLLQKCSEQAEFLKKHGKRNDQGGKPGEAALDQSQQSEDSIYCSF